MVNKEKYLEFCKNVYVPIFSKPWWMDAVCGPDSWDVWLYETKNGILAAMPYYFENRGDYKYITKAKLTQNNGIIFNFPDELKITKKAEIEEKVINTVDMYIESLGLDVYEQQYHYSFNNWQPFFWNNYTCLLRYTYVIDTSDLSVVEKGFTSKLRAVIRKGKKNCNLCTEIPLDEFYTEHEKVFSRQGIECPFTREFWHRLYEACDRNNACLTMAARDSNGTINSLAFYVWDEKSLYLLLGGSMPEFANKDTYSYVIYEGIRLAAKKKLKFDFEGSMIKRIAKAARQFGGIPEPYYRIRKVFNEDIIRSEAEDYIKRVKEIDR